MGETRLLELKARDPDLTRAQNWCAQHATPVEVVRQKDTYFRVRGGRLKLRVVEGRDEGTLIYYQREDTPDPKRSQVSLLRVANPDAVLGILREALGILVEVKKWRRIFRWGEVLIHLDQVDGLGTFLEFERVVASDKEVKGAEAEFAELRAALHVSGEELEAGSYSDMVLEAR